VSKEKKYTQSRVFEFKPNSDITTEEILELVKLVRIGISGDTIASASVKLKKHFEEVKDAPKKDI